MGLINKIEQKVEQEIYKKTHQNQQQGYNGQQQNMNQG